jgi:hypothetical protein
MKKTLIYIVIAAVLVGLAAYKISSNKSKQEAEVAEVAKEVDKINVNVVTVQYESINTDYTANGTFLPKAETNLSSEISGKVVSVLVKEGSRVRAGTQYCFQKRSPVHPCYGTLLSPSAQRGYNKHLSHQKLPDEDFSRGLP